MKSLIYDFLDIGQENALSPEYIKNALGFSSIRAVQKQIEHERSMGHVILSSSTPPGGYYRPSSAKEIRKFIATLQNRGVKTLSALDGAKKLLAEIEKGVGND